MIYKFYINAVGECVCCPAVFCYGDEENARNRNGLNYIRAFMTACSQMNALI